MNYGKKKAAKRQKKITSKSTMQGKRIVVRLFKALLICIVLAAVVGMAGGGLFIKKIIDDTPHVSTSDVKPKGFTTFVYADDGSTEIERFVSSGSNRVYKSIDEIPKNLQHAFVAIEDERFYKHNGIDLQGIARAAVVGIARGGFSEGASTLTQQLIKNNVFPNFTKEKNFYDKLQRKIQEQYLAVQIEKQMNKNEIMESYLNTINLGQNCLGVQSASQRYFGKDVSDLTLSECAVIAGITQNPTDYDPVTRPENNKIRRNKVLKNMLEQGYISQKQYDKAMSDDVYARIQATSASSQADNAYSYFVDALAQQVIQDLKDQLGYTDTQAYNAVYSGGLSIYSTQNQEMQKICDEEANNDANYPGLKEYGLDYALTVTRADGSVENYGSNNIKNYVEKTYGNDQGLLYSSEDAAKAMVAEWKSTIAQEGDTYDERITITPQPQSSITIMDQKTGQIKAMVGGYDFALNKFNHVTQAWRQPGSSFKPFIYSAAIEKGFSPQTVINDAPIVLDPSETGFKKWNPKNFSGKFSGPIMMKDALKKSLNLVSIRILQAITPRYAVDFIQRFGFDSDKHPPHLSMALGAGSVTPWQMVEGFSVFANIGRRTEPYLISKVTDASGKVLMQSTAEAEKVAGVEALDPRNAYIMHQMLHGVATSGTAARATASLKRTDIAGKTGTSNDAFDVWFVGYAGDQCAAVWMGFDQPRSLGRRAQGAGLALPVWIDYMRDAIKNEPNVVRKAPPGVTEEGGNLYYTNRKDAIPNLGLDQPATDDPIGALIHDSSVRGQIF